MGSWGLPALAPAGFPSGAVCRSCSGLKIAFILVLSSFQRSGYSISAIPLMEGVWQAASALAILLTRAHIDLDDAYGVFFPILHVWHLQLPPAWHLDLLPEPSHSQNPLPSEPSRGGWRWGGGQAGPLHLVTDLVRQVFLVGGCESRQRGWAALHWPRKD